MLCRFRVVPVMIVRSSTGPVFVFFGDLSDCKSVVNNYMGGLWKNYRALKVNLPLCLFLKGKDNSSSCVKVGGCDRDPL
jgi:hypothetical protein